MVQQNHSLKVCFSEHSTVSIPNALSFITVSNFGDGTTKRPGDVYVVGNKNQNSEKPNQFTNGPHGAEYQLGSKIPQSPFPVNNGPNADFNLLNPIKLTRKEDGDSSPVSLITPLTHLTVSGSFPSSDKPSSTGPNQSSTFATGPSNGYQPSTNINPNTSPVFGSGSPVYNPNGQSTNGQPGRETNPSHPSGFFTVTTPKAEPTRGVITHMNPVSQTRDQSRRVTPSVTSNSPSDEHKSNSVFSNQAGHFTPGSPTNVRPLEPVRSTEYPFLYTRSRTTPENGPYDGEPGSGSLYPDSITGKPGDELTIYSEFGQKNKPGANPATTSFTAYHPESTPQPLQGGGNPVTNQRNSYPSGPNDNFPNQPKFVLKPNPNSNRQPQPNLNGFPDTQIRNANFYPDSDPQKSNDKNLNNIQSDGKYVNTKKDFVPPQYNPNSSPVPGLST